MAGHLFYSDLSIAAKNQLQQDRRIANAQCTARAGDLPRNQPYSIVWQRINVAEGIDTALIIQATGQLGARAGLGYCRLFTRNLLIMACRNHAKTHGLTLKKASFDVVL